MTAYNIIPLVLDTVKVMICNKAYSVFGKGSMAIGDIETGPNTVTPNKNHISRKLFSNNKN